MKNNMGKIGLTLLTAFVGGAVAIGAYKLLDNKSLTGMTLDERQKVYFANSKSPIVSSTGALDFTEAAAAVSPGVVHVRTTYNRTRATQGRGADPFGDMFEDFFGRRGRPQSNTPARGKGSGVIVTTDGYIMTNNHVVDNADQIEVILTDKRVVSAKVIGKDKTTDLALIKIDVNNLPIVKLGNSDDVRVGEWVLAVGYPLTLESTVTAGIVSAKARKIGILDQDNIDPNNFDPENPPVSSSIESFIQTDAVINRGNSGGALVNANGELIGINSAIASQTGTYEGYGFAIPINLAKKVMDDFLKYGEVKRGYIGVNFQELNSDLAKELNVKEINGLYVSSTLEGGAAASAGIKKGDIIKKLDNTIVITSAELQEKIGRKSPGDKVSVTVLRDGNLKTFNLTLKGLDENRIAAGKEVEPSQLFNSLGATFTPLKDSDKAKFNVNSGVIVSSVSPGKIFDMYDIPKGTLITSINGKGVNNINQINAALAAGKQDLLAIQGITPDGGKFRFTFPIK
jgi:serine protease Do